LQNLRFDRTPEGLRVQIVDNEGRSMFDRGSSRIEPRTRDLITIIATAIADLPNPVAISGHTDSVPYARQTGYSNWELSADRANATRRIMVDAGVNVARINRISGLADTLPLNAADPTAAENRRISVLISYPPITATNGEAGADRR
jgi:chemotaxis protein MotB